MSGQSLAPCEPAAGPGHVGFDPGFINEDQALGVKPVLMRPPARPEPRDLRAELLSGHQGLFFTLSPAALTKRQTVSCATWVPRAASSAASPRIVRSGFSASRANSQSPTAPCRTGRRWPPILPGSRPRPERSRCPIRTAVATETLNRLAAPRTVSPSAKAAATRSFRSTDSGLAMIAPNDW